MFDTPSPELKRTSLWMANHQAHPSTPKGIVCRKIADSPAFLASKNVADYTELSMSPLQLLDSPVHQQSGVMTPGTSSGESSTGKQTSTPSVAKDTPKNKAFHVANTVVKAKRRLIEDPDSSGAVACKKHKPSTVHSIKKPKRSFGKINSGVFHRIRRPDKTPTLSLTLSLSDLKKAKAGSSPKNPLDPVVTFKPEPKEEPTVPEALAVLQSPAAVRKAPVETQQSPAAIRKPQTQSPAAIKKPQTQSPATVKRDSYKPYVSNWNDRYKNKEIKERKFFKPRADRDRAGLVTVSVNDNLKLQIVDKPAIQQENKLPVNKVEPTPKVAAEVVQQDWDDDNMMDMSVNIQDILAGLSDEEEKPVEIKPSTEEEEKPVEMQQPPTEEDDSAKENVPKLFPLFYKQPAAQQPSPSTTEPKKSSSLKSQWMKAKNDGQTQTMLDAGQKAFGAVQCPECMLVYQIKDPEDELLHAKVHDSLKDTLKFTGWKKERLIRRFDGAEVLAVHPGDAAYCWKKVHSVLKNVVDHELGFSEIGIRAPESTKVYLYVTEKKIAGVLVAESISRAFRMTTEETSDVKCCSSTPTPAVVGVSRIWTLASYRRRKIASRLLDAMRSDFIYGKVINPDEVAFSDPTDNGLALGRNYSKRPDFLVYNM